MITPPLTQPTVLSASFLTLADLTERGLSRHRVRCLVAAGRLVRLRNGRYVAADTSPSLVDCGALGGRLDCVSLLSALGIFVRVRPALHAQFEPGTARLPARPKNVIAHWRPSTRPRRSLTADLVEALAQSCRCQEPRDAIATLDSAWHLRLVDEPDITAVFALLPRRYRRLRRLLDRRAESGSESLVRLMLRALGCHFDVQVVIDGVGRVDFVVDGWLIVECDSEAHHSDWRARKRDLRRDVAAAGLGYTTIRLLAEDIFAHPDVVTAWLRAAIAHGTGPRAHNARPAPRQNSTDRRGMTV